MAIRNKDTLKAYFLNGKKPNEEHFGDLLDSMTHKEEVIKTDVEFASINEAEDGDNNQKSMSPFLVRKAIETLVKFDHAPTLKTEIENLISENTNDLRNGVNEAYDTLSEIVSLVDTKATRADITSILSDKLSISSLINNLDSTSTTTAPTANTVRLLKEMILVLNNLSLGETSGTAYRGDRGKTAYDHSQSSHAPANAQKNSDITKTEIESKLTGEISTHSHNIESEVWAILEKKSIVLVTRLICP
jgi:hypothetical protein